MPQLMGIDLGTSSVKVIVVDLDGRILGVGSAEYPIYQPAPGMAEQDPLEWWLKLVFAVRQALSVAGETIEIAAIGLVGQMHGTVLLDDRSLPVTPAVIWPDQRTGSQVQEITKIVGAEHLIDITGSPLATGFQAATLRWFQQEHPEIWQSTEKVLLPKDYIRWCMTGKFASDPSDACSTLLLDARTRDWSLELLEILEIDSGRLPPVLPSTAIAGYLQEGAAIELGITTGVPIVTGAGDTASSVLGAGVTQPDTILINISTGGQLVQPIYDLQVDLKGRIHTFCSALESGPRQAGWYKLGGILSAGLSLRWLRENVFVLRDESAYQRMTSWAAEAPVGADGLLFLPHLVGERTPFMNAQARGMFLGLTLAHQQAHLVRAVLEGVGLGFYQAYVALVDPATPAQRIVLAGGGSRSSLWCQIMADIFGIPVQRLAVPDQSALGAALLAGAGIELFEPTEQIHLWAEYDSPMEPSPENHTSYLQIAERFQQAYNVHRNDFQV